MADTKTTVGAFLISMALIAVVVISGLGIKSCASQSGTLSRWTGSAVELEAPDDCVQVINMGKSQTTKFLVYRNNKDEIIMHEYSDWGMLEATYKIEGATFDSKLVRKNK